MHSGTNNVLDNAAFKSIVIHPPLFNRAYKVPTVSHMMMLISELKELLMCWDM